MDAVAEGTPKRGRQLGPEDLAEAAVLRWRLGLSWEEVAERLGTTRKTLFKHRQKPQWREVAKACLEDMRAEGVETAYGCLMRAAQANDVQAAKELLDRLLGKVTQGHDVSVNGKVNFSQLSDKELRQWAKLDAKLSNGKASSDDAGS